MKRIASHCCRERSTFLSFAFWRSDRSPALQRLEAQQWISAEWGVSSNNRRARFYTLTAKGRKHLTQETGRWRKLAAAMARILDLEKLESLEG
jgi:DNA-binding PadR family transcriptional regulator